MNQYFNYYLHLDSLIDNYGTVNETLLYNYLNNNKIPYNLIDIDYLVILSLFNTIAITGDSGSGKTTITKILKNIFNNSFILECDRYHKWERHDINWKNYTHLNPEANFITKMQNDVFDLKIGNNIYQIDYDHKTGKFTDKELIESKENIIVCGLHSLYMPDIILNLKIYMDTDDNLRMPWKIKRDIVKRGYTVEKIYDQIKNRQTDFDKYIYPQKEKADIIINFYTDNIFDIHNFDINFVPKVYLKIGIKSTYKIDKIINKLTIESINLVDNFFYMYFKQVNDYEEIIKIIIMNLK
jgi:uridine kinase